MTIRYILLVFLLCCVTALKAQKKEQIKEQTADLFLRDMYKVNKAYSQLGNGIYTYEYRIYSDSLKANLLKEFPVTVVKTGSRSYYEYLGSELLYDSVFTLIISHDDKQVNLLRSQQEASPVNIASLIDTNAFKAMIAKTTHLSVLKKNRVTTYTLLFSKEAQLASMTISFEENGMIRELSTCIHQPNAEQAEPLPMAMTISFKSITPGIKYHKATDTATYFKLFGNGRYVLSDSYQTFNLNNLYEKQDF